MKSIVNDTVTYFVGKSYQKQVVGTEITYKKTYMAGSKQIAVRTITGSTNTLNWLLTDHLGSTSVSANEDGSWNSTIKYNAFGCPYAARRVLRKTRESSGITPTKYRYTGQLLEAEVGLYYYVARFYDPVTMHFTQADTIVPNATDSASYDRYAYVLNNPVRYSDPSGHVCDDMGNCVVNRGERIPNGTKLSPVKANTIHTYIQKRIATLYSYNISVSGMTKEQEKNVFNAAQAIGDTFSEIIGNGSGVDAFTSVLGSITIVIDPYRTTTNCETIESTIYCHPGVNLTIGTIVHEMFHVIDYRYKLTNADEKLISNSLPLEYANSDFQHGSYKCDGKDNDYACQSHPSTQIDSTTFEAFANMGENWVLEKQNIDPDNHGFVNENGETLRNWMNDNMPVFIGIIVDYIGP